jgi:hypothetical protein
MGSRMRSHNARFVVPPYNGQFFPHRAFPPWRSLRPLFEVIVAAQRRASSRAPLRHVEIPLVQAAKRIAAVAAGNLPPGTWHRRARVAIEQLERVKRASGVYVRSGMLTVADEQEIVAVVDQTIASLVDVVACTPLPDEIRRSLPELQAPPQPAP